MPRELQLSDIWGVVIALGAFVVLLNLRTIWGWARMVMSRLWRAAPDSVPVVRPVDQQPTIAVRPVATTGNAINDGLSDNSLSIEEAREIIRFQAKVEALAALIRSGQVTNLAKGIERTFDCSRSSKEDSVYQRARRAIDPLIQTGPQYRITPEQEAARDALGLRSRQNA